MEETDEFLPCLLLRWIGIRVYLCQDKQNLRHRLKVITKRQDGGVKKKMQEIFNNSKEAQNQKMAFLCNESAQK